MYCVVDKGCPQVERLSESHPYNAVWAQLCELSGAVGYPPRAARTLLVGSNASLLSQLLTILSYIIRCSQVGYKFFIHISVFKVYIQI